jgi:hypothetical protein
MTDSPPASRRRSIISLRKPGVFRNVLSTGRLPDQEGD